MAILMLTIEYDQSQMPEPPHSVPPEEIETLWSCDWIDASPRFQAHGLETRRDHVLRLRREISEGQPL